jgi:hypothetical protein
MLVIRMHAPARVCAMLLAIRPRLEYYKRAFLILRILMPVIVPDCLHVLLTLCSVKSSILNMGTNLCDVFSGVYASKMCLLLAFLVQSLAFKRCRVGKPC